MVHVLPGRLVIQIKLFQRCGLIIIIILNTITIPYHSKLAYSSSTAQCPSLTVPLTQNGTHKVLTLSKPSTSRSGYQVYKSHKVSAYQQQYYKADNKMGGQLLQYTRPTLTNEAVTTCQAVSKSLDIVPLSSFQSGSEMKKKQWSSERLPVGICKTTTNVNISCMPTLLAQAARSNMISSVFYY